MPSPAEAAALELMDVDIARFAQLWDLCSEAEKDRLFEQMPESWKYTMTARENRPEPQQVQQVQRRLAQADAAARERAHMRWLAKNSMNLPAPYDN